MNPPNDKYLFQSARLGFRNWSTEDLAEITEMNADKDVMEHFPKLLTPRETNKLFERLRTHFDDNGYTYFATEVINTGELIGFIGLALQEYETDFTPATDIGWRLKKSAWGHGYATEGAKRCLAYAFEDLNIDKVISTCTLRNSKSENVMKKIGMKRQGEFDHPGLSEYPDYQKCIWYEIDKKV